MTKIDKGRKVISTVNFQKRRNQCFLSSVFFLVAIVAWFLQDESALSSLSVPRNLSKQRETKKNILRSSNSPSGAIVLLAPQRNQGSFWATDRFCLLLRAIRSVDRHLNAQFGPYPIFVLVARDYALDPLEKDAAYTPEDRRLLRKWAPNSELIFM